jgi:L-2-hydroxyglutarate oxidase LhgO
VIAAGVVGLAVARALATAGREVLILEADDAIGKHTSSRNSEVIHAGIYYPRESLKARTCVEGSAAPTRLLRRARGAAPGAAASDRRHRRRAIGGAGVTR